MTQFPTAIQPYIPVGSTFEPFELASLEGNFLYMTLMQRYKQMGAESYRFDRMIERFGAEEVYVLLDNGYLTLVENDRVMLSFLVPGTLAYLMSEAKRLGTKLEVKVPRKRRQNLEAFIGNFMINVKEPIAVAC